MAQQLALKIVDQRAATARLRWLTLEAPKLARNLRPGHYLLVRCAAPGSYDPLLRRALFVAAAEPALGQIGLLYEPSEPGLAWLARSGSGDLIDVIGPLGQPFLVDERSRNLLLVGQGPGLAALLLLARSASARGAAVTLFAGAVDTDGLPPAFLLPGEVEYQGFIGSQVADFKLQQVEEQSPISNLQSAIGWADQLFAALPNDQLPAVYDAIRAVKYRWDRGFASALLEGPLICGVGACGVCAVELRKKSRLLCEDGPVFDMRELVGAH